MIKVENLNKSYPDGKARKNVLSSLDLDAGEGEFITIVGSSGSGKTTLLNIIGGLDVDYDGVVTVCGLQLRNMNDRELSAFRNGMVGFVFQTFNLISHITLQENVALPSCFAALESDAIARAEEVVSMVGLSDKLSVKPPELSGGQKQRAAIARALFNRPKLLLCDEPTGNLDKDTGLKILEIFSALARENRITVVCVTHEAHVAAVADTIYRLSEGRLGRAYKDSLF